MIETLLATAATVGIAELGDKTQLLVLMLARRFRRPVLVGFGMLAAFAVSNTLAALLGAWVNALLPDHLLAWIVGGLFIAIGLWTAFDDDGDDEAPERPTASGWRVALSVFAVFMLAELGDKSQLTTAGLSAALSGWWAVAAGATLGAGLVNLPVIWLGHGLQSPRVAAAFRWGGAVLFVLIGIAVIVGGLLKA